MERQDTQQYLQTSILFLMICTIHYLRDRRRSARFVLREPPVARPFLSNEILWSSLGNKLHSDDANCASNRTRQKMRPRHPHVERRRAQQETQKHGDTVNRTPGSKEHISLLRALRFTTKLHPQIKMTSHAIIRTQIGPTLRTIYTLKSIIPADPDHHHFGFAVATLGVVGPLVSLYIVYISRVCRFSCWVWIGWRGVYVDMVYTDE